MESIHKTVLLHEAINGLNLDPKSGGKPVVLDATFGGGGHSLEICRRYPGARILAFDQDKNSFQKAKDKFRDINCDISFINENFRNMDIALQKERINGVEGIIFDLGLSSDQLLNSGRGFSFMQDEPLLMTMKDSPSKDEVTALDVVNTWSEEHLADILHGYGEEKFAKRIARGIVRAGAKKKLETSFDLVNAIENSIPPNYRSGKLHFATRSFQAIRIAVNDELGALSEGLNKGFEILKKGGRMAVISFHSLEDRIVKRFYKTKQIEGKAKSVNKKVIRASREEISHNPRSRSAKLRILEKIQ